MKNRSTVVLRTPWVLLAIGLPVIGFFDVGLIWAVVDSVRTGNADQPFESSDIHGFGVVIGWTIAGTILSLCLLATIALPMLRVRLIDDRIEMRKLMRTRTIRLDDLTSVTVTNPPSWMVNGSRSSVAPCLELRGTTPGGRRAYIGLNQKMLDWTAALRWLTPWLRAHPDRSDARTMMLLDHLDDPPPPSEAPRSADAQVDAMDLVQRLHAEEGRR